MPIKLENLRKPELQVDRSRQGVGGLVLFAGIPVPIGRAVFRTAPIFCAGNNQIYPALMARKENIRIRKKVNTVRKIKMEAPLEVIYFSVFSR